MPTSHREPPRGCREPLRTSLGESALEFLRAHGVTLDDLVTSALELYEPCEEADAEKTVEEVSRRLRRVIEEESSDLNISLLVKAAAHLEEELNRTGLTDDPAYLLCDELIGMSIAEFIHGKKALFNFVRYDVRKPGILAKLGVFMDDAVAGLIAGCMTKLLDEWR